MFEHEHPADWRPTSVYDLAEWANGLAFRDIQFSDTGKPVIKIAELKGGIAGQTRFTVEQFDPSVHVSSGDMLFSWSGNPETSIDVFIWDGPDGWLNQHIFRVIPREGVNRRFLYYILKFLKPSFTRIASNKQTTGLGHVTIKDLKSMTVGLPLPKEQESIIELLAPLDDKIELNRQMNATLEAMAQALFQSWFVDFDPVREKAAGRKPAGIAPDIAALFPDQILSGPKGEIPASWNVVTVGDTCVNIFSGGTPSTKNLLYWDGGIPWLSSGETRNRFIIDTEKTITHAGVTESSTRRARAGCTVIASAGQGYTRGQTSLLTFETYINQSVVGLVADPLSSSDLFLFFDLARRYDEFRQLSDSHSSRGSLTTKLLSGVMVKLPPKPIVAAYDEAVLPLVDRITINLHQSRTLAELRDALLPKLLSGEIRVKDAARQVEETV